MTVNIKRNWETGDVEVRDDVTFELVFSERSEVEAERRLQSDGFRRIAGLMWHRREREAQAA